MQDKEIEPTPEFSDPISAHCVHNFSGTYSHVNYLVSRSRASNTWIVDSGASNHMCSCKNFFEKLVSTAIVKPMHLPDGSIKEAR